MAETNLQRDDLMKQLQQLITLSIGLKFEEKDQLMGKLPALSDAQLQQLIQVFEQEKTRKEQLLSEFFSKNPQLYHQFERFSQEHVNEIYEKVEDEEQGQEQADMEALLQTSF